MNRVAVDTTGQGRAKGTDKDGRRYTVLCVRAYVGRGLSHQVMAALPSRGCERWGAWLWGRVLAASSPGNRSCGSTSCSRTSKGTSAAGWFGVN